MARHPCRAGRFGIGPAASGTPQPPEGTMPTATLTDEERQARREADRQKTRDAVQALRARPGLGPQPSRATPGTGRAHAAGPTDRRARRRHAQLDATGTHRPGRRARLHADLRESPRRPWRLLHAEHQADLDQPRPRRQPPDQDTRPRARPRAHPPHRPRRPRAQLRRRRDRRRVNRIQRRRRPRDRHLRILDPLPHLLEPRRRRHRDHRSLRGADRPPRQTHRKRDRRATQPNCA